MCWSHARRRNGTRSEVPVPVAHSTLHSICTRSMLSTRQTWRRIECRRVVSTRPRPRRGSGTQRRRQRCEVRPQACIPNREIDVRAESGRGWKTETRPSLLCDANPLVHGMQTQRRPHNDDLDPAARRSTGSDHLTRRSGTWRRGEGHCIGGRDSQYMLPTRAIHSTGCVSASWTIGQVQADAVSACLGPETRDCGPEAVVCGICGIHGELLWMGSLGMVIN